MLYSWNYATRSSIHEIEPDGSNVGSWGVSLSNTSTQYFDTYPDGISPGVSGVAGTIVGNWNYSDSKGNWRRGDITYETGFPVCDFYGDGIASTPWYGDSFWRDWETALNWSGNWFGVANEEHSGSPPSSISGPSFIIPSYDPPVFPAWSLEISCASNPDTGAAQLHCSLPSSTYTYQYPNSIGSITIAFFADVEIIPVGGQSDSSTSISTSTSTPSSSAPSTPA